jgi:phospholipid transport system substrate-binding protein
MKRRAFIASTAALALFAALPARALTTDQASGLIGKLTGDITSVINSGKSEPAMYKEFEKLFTKYADVNAIARATLGPPARSASAAQMKTFTATFKSYISRKYGKRFREFIGGKVEVKNTRKINDRQYEVYCVALLQGEPPFDVSFRVSDQSGKDLFFDMLIEGISLLKAEKTEVGSLLDKNRGDIDKMIAALAQAA